MVDSTCQVLVFVFAVTSVVVTRVFVRPPKFVAVPGGNATFHCFSSNLDSSDGINSIQWLLNDTLLENHLQLRNLMAVTKLTNSGRGTILLVNVPESINMTRISCRIDHDTLSQADQVPVNPSLLLIQGNLSIDSLNITVSNSTIFLTWVAPFTSITELKPTYCVDVHVDNSSLHSECGITETQFIISYPTPPDAHCHVYRFTLLPTAVVGYGEATTFPYYMTKIAPVIESLEFSTCDLDAILIMSAPVCTVELTLVDLDTDSIVILRDDDVTKLENTLTFSATLLTANRHYNLTVVSSNAAGVGESHTLLDYHAISTAEISDSEDMSIMISIGYSTHSLAQAQGALLVFLSSDFSRIFMLTVERSLSQNYTWPFGLPPGQFLVFVYDIERDGTLSSGQNYPAVTLNFVTSGNNPDIGINLEASYLLNSCLINSSFHVIWAECTYPSNSEVVGYQVLALLSNSTSHPHVLFSSKAISPQTSVAIPVEEEGLYLVSIIAIRRGTGVLGASVEYREIVTVKDTSTDQETSIADIVIERCSAPSRGILIGIGSGYIVLLLLVFISLVTNVVQWKLNKIRKSKVAADLPREDHQLYAEIREPSPSSSLTWTQNIGTSHPVTATPAPAPVPVPAPTPVPPQYEDETLAVPKSGGDYQFTQCEAYGL